MGKRANYSKFPSSRHLAILSLAAQGKSNRTIAEILGIKESTVKSSIVISYERLDALNRTHAVVMAHRKGLIDLLSEEFA